MCCVKQGVTHTNASVTLHVLLGTLRMLLTHMHHRCSLRTVLLVTVKALEIFVNLSCTPSYGSVLAPLVGAPFGYRALTLIELFCNGGIYLLRDLM